MRGEKKGKRTVFKGQKERRVLGSALGREGKGENRKRRRRGVGNQRRGARKGFRRKEQAAFFLVTKRKKRKL